METKHIAAFCEPGPSHIKNTAAIGRELMRRGHRFTLFHLPELEDLVSSEGVAFAALSGNRRSSLVNAEKEILYPVHSKQEGHSAENFLSFATKSARLLCETAPEALRAAEVDGVLVDISQPGAATAAEHLRLPYVTICHALPLHRDAQVPPDFLPWAYRDAWWAKCRNVLAYRFRDLMISPLNKVLNGYRKKWGLRPYRRPEDSFSRLAQITQLVKEFDFVRPNLPACFHYVGPYRRSTYTDVRFPFERLDGRPIIYASLGTSRGYRTDIWQAIANGCAGLKAQLIVSLGGAPRTREIEGLPGNPLVVDYAPQIELLSRAGVVITHAGLNTVLEALGKGVPVIAVPITGDQFGVAARLAHCGAGKVVHLKDFRALTVKAAVQEALNRPDYRAHARKMQEAIEQSRGAETAAQIIEQAVSTRTPVFAHA